MCESGKSCFVISHIERKEFIKRLSAMMWEALSRTIF
jgi:hypothetical protein